MSNQIVDFVVQNFRRREEQRKNGRNIFGDRKYPFLGREERRRKRRKICEKENIFYAV